jgi:hypothetical protein
MIRVVGGPFRAKSPTSKIFTHDNQGDEPPRQPPQGGNPWKSCDDLPSVLGSHAMTSRASRNDEGRKSL